MSLDTAKLKTDLKGVYDDTYTTTGDKDAALEAFIDAFADKLEAYIQSGTVVYISGLTAGENLVEGVFNGHLQ